MEKRWVSLFTCMTTRAIPLEMVNSLDADAFIMALRRFAARRGACVPLTCDNGTNFHGAERELREVFLNSDHTRIADTMSGHGREFLFNPPAVTHFGGVFERLLRTVKTTLYTLLSVLVTPTTSTSS